MLKSLYVVGSSGVCPGGAGWLQVGSYCTFPGIRCAARYSWEQVGIRRKEWAAVSAEPVGFEGDCSYLEAVVAHHQSSRAVAALLLSLSKWAWGEIWRWARTFGFWVVYVHICLRWAMTWLWSLWNINCLASSMWWVRMFRFVPDCVKLYNHSHPVCWSQVRPLWGSKYPAKYGLLTYFYMIENAALLLKQKMILGSRVWLCVWLLVLSSIQNCFFCCLTAVVKKV